MVIVDERSNWSNRLNFKRIKISSYRVQNLLFLCSVKIDRCTTLLKHNPSNTDLKWIVHRFYERLGFCYGQSKWVDVYFALFWISHHIQRSYDDGCVYRGMAQIRVDLSCFLQCVFMCVCVYVSKPIAAERICTNG